MGEKRRAYYKGTWYEADPAILSQHIRESLQSISQGENQQHHIRCAVIPHAGLLFSMRGISHMLGAITRPITHVLLLAPSHYYPLPADTISFYPFESFETPLGDLQGYTCPLEGAIPLSSQAFEREHALEMVLPFLAYLQKEQHTPIHVSMMMISEVTTPAVALEIGKALQNSLKGCVENLDDLLVIASSDFTHYGPRFGYTPYKGSPIHTVVENVKSLDTQIALYCAQTQLAQLFHVQKHERLTICGIAAMSIVSAYASLQHLEGSVVDYYTSLDVMDSNYAEFVAYATIMWR